MVGLRTEAAHVSAPIASLQFGGHAELHASSFAQGRTLVRLRRSATGWWAM